MAIKYSNNSPRGSVSSGTTASGSTDDRVSDKEPNMYEITWSGGLLGLIFKQSNESKMPRVRRVNPKGEARGLEKASVGDTLVELNGKPVCSRSFDEIVAELKTGSFPMRLILQPCATPPRLTTASSVCSSAFSELNRQVDNQDESTYEIVWNDGTQLGITLKEMNRSAVVRRVSGELERKVQLNDVLIQVNETSMKDVPFSTIMNLLKFKPKPLRLLFSHPIKETETTNYVVYWGDEPLGIVLKENDDREVYVDRLTNKGLSQRMDHHFHLGDILLSIADISVTDIGFKQSINILKSVQKPVKLVFSTPIQSAPSLEHQFSGCSLNDSQAGDDETENFSDLDLDDSYRNDSFSSFHVDDAVDDKNDLALDWTGGPLGVTLKKSNDNYVLVSRLTGRGYTEGLTKLATGDELIGVNGLNTREIGFDETLQLLKTLPKPVTLSFIYGK